MNFWERLSLLDRRWIFLFVGVSVLLPMTFNLECRQVPSPIVRGIYDHIETLPPGSRIVLSFDYGPSTVPEISPMAYAVIRHALEKDLRIIFMALWATGQNILTATMNDVVRAEFPDKVYGTDYANFGYKAGNQGVINVIVTDFYKMFTTDVDGATAEDMPLMEGIGHLGDVKLIISFGGGFPGIKEWVQFAGDLAQVPVAGGCTAVSAPRLYPYNPQPFIGLMGGIKGAAEYEALLTDAYPQYDHLPKRGMEMMGPQTVAHLVIMFFIVIGNMAYFATRNKIPGGPANS
jgi:hypothetical protein